MRYSFHCGYVDVTILEYVCPYTDLYSKQPASCTGYLILSSKPWHASALLTANHFVLSVAINSVSQVISYIFWEPHCEMQTEVPIFSAIDYLQTLALQQTTATFCLYSMCLDVCVCVCLCVFEWVCVYHFPHCFRSCSSNENCNCRSTFS